MTSFVTAFGIEERDLRTRQVIRRKEVSRAAVKAERCPTCDAESNAPCRTWVQRRGATDVDGYWRRRENLHVARRSAALAKVEWQDVQP